MVASESPGGGASRIPLDAELLRSRVVAAGGLWTGLTVLPEVGSTNVEMAGRARLDASHGDVLVAEEQTAGRGRRDRVWAAPACAAATLSVLVRPSQPPSRWGWIPLLTGLAVVDAVSGYGVTAHLKWPNDVMVDGRKLCGVLCEVVPTPTGSSVVAGWGVNVDQDASELPAEAATSVRLAGGSVDRAGLVVDMLAAWERWYRRWERADPSVAGSYAAHSSTLGQTVRASLPDGNQVQGLAVRISDNGGLVIGVGGGEREVTAADVVHLRSASP